MNYLPLNLVVLFFLRWLNSCRNYKQVATLNHIAETEIFTRKDCDIWLKELIINSLQIHTATRLPLYLYFKDRNKIRLLTKKKYRK